MEQRTRIENVADIYRTAYQDKILTVLIPLLWALRNRVRAVSSAKTDTELATAVEFFTGSMFVTKVTALVRDICNKARDESLDAQAIGLTAQRSGLSFFIVSDSMLEEHIYPSIDGLLGIFRSKAEGYHPTKDRSFVRICQRLDEIINTFDTN